MSTTIAVILFFAVTAYAVYASAVAAATTISRRSTSRTE